jgi:acetyl esterase/lipase
MTLRGVVVLGWLAVMSAGAAVAQIPQFANPGDADPATYTEFKAVPFARPGGHELVTEVYLPKGSGPFPGLVFIHGGGWGGGTRMDNRRQAVYMAAHGMVSISIEYRLSGVAPFTAQIEDCRAAVRWLRAHAAEYHVDPKRIGLVGISAGAHIASLMGLENDEDPGSAVQAVVSISGVYDLGDPAATQLTVPIAHLMGKPCAEAPEPCRMASPLYRVHPGAPPYLVMHGDNDTLAPTADAVAFVAKMQEAGNPVERFTAFGTGHSFWHDAPWIYPAEMKMGEFLAETLAAKP